jgi:antitoxin component of MazEF toxin-antitoxin module
MTLVKIQPDGSVRLPAKLLREAQMAPGTRVAVAVDAGQLSLRAERAALERAYAAYYRAATANVRREQLDIEHDFAAADAEVMESLHAPTTPAPRRRVHRPARPHRRRRDS